MRTVCLILGVIVASTAAEAAGPPLAPPGTPPLAGVAATVQPLATRAALAALERDGNAIDAAVAAGLTLGVVDGHNSGIGGGCFMLIRLADGRLVCLDGRETAPAAATADMFLRGGKPVATLSQIGPLTVGVAGALAASAHAAARFGRLPLAAACENSRFSVDASVRITLIDRDMPSYFRSLDHLLRYCARLPFALERLSVIRGPDGRIARIRYVLPRHKAANWVGPGRGRKSTRPDANGVFELSPLEFLDRLAELVPPPRKHWHRYHGVFAPNHKLRRAVTALAKRQRRHAARGRCRWAWARRLRHGRLLRRESRDAKATLARHITACLGETHGPGG